MGSIKIKSNSKSQQEKPQSVSHWKATELLLFSHSVSTSLEASPTLEPQVNIWMPRNSFTRKPAAKDFNFHLFKEKEVLELGK